MKNAKKLLCLLLALALCVSALAGCGNSTSQPASGSTSAPADASEPAEANDTLVVATEMGLEGKFSPFFALSGADQDVVDMFNVTSLMVDRVSNIVDTSIEGETRSYNGTDYVYTGAGDVVVTENDDGSVSYDITIRDDMKFSDGTPVDIDDLIFSYYVYLDPTYDGAMTLYSIPIKGLDAYRQGMSVLYELLLEAGEDNTDFTYWDEAAQKDFWENGLPAAGEVWAQSILDYCVANGYNAADDPVEAIAVNWGYELEAGATAADFFDAIMANEAFEGSYQNASDVESADRTLFQCLDAKYTVGVATGDSADYIEGIERTGDYSVRVTTTELSANSIYQVGQSLAPLHWYGDESLYNYDEHQFGFPKGDLSGVKAKTSTPLGAGPYVFKDYSNGVVYMEANPYYFKGEPETKYLNFKETSEDNMVSGVVTGTLDIADPSYSTDVAKQIAVENGFSEDEWENFDGPVMTTRLIDFRGYGYVGINPNNVKVGDDPYSEESKDLRKALATMISVYRDEAIDSYYGPTASIINYPISNTSWAAPQTTDDGYKVAYSVDVNGEPIYTADMDAQARYDAALEAALGYFEAAGFTVEDGKVTAAPEGAKLGYQVDIGAGGSGDHPSFLLLKNVSDALASIGITFTVNDIANSSELYAAYQNGVSELWCAAWQAASDPDMYQVYHSEGPSNYYQVKDETLDETIMAARKSTDQTYRKTLYQAAMEIVMDYAVEIPIYQRSECVLLSSERVVADSLPGDMTPYWGWGADIETVAVK